MDDEKQPFTGARRDLYGAGDVADQDTVRTGSDRLPNVRPQPPGGNTAPYYHNMPDGVGVVLLIGPVVGGVNQVIAHPLGRPPRRIEVLDTDVDFIPKTKRSGVWDATAINATFDTNFATGWIRLS